MEVGTRWARPDRTAVTTMEAAEWRERTLQGVLTTTAIVAAVAYFPGVIAAATAGMYGLVAIDTAAWALVITLALWRTLPFGVRAGTFIALFYLLAVTLLWLVGPVGAGIAWLLAVPVLGALFFGRRGAIVTLAGVVVVSLAFVALLLPGTAATLGDVPGPPYDMTSWAASAGSTIFLGVLLAVAIAHVVSGLAQGVSELRHANTLLEDALTERERLERELVRTAKTRALGTLASGIAHDLNNLLVPMLMAGTDARDSVPAGSPQRARLDQVVSSAERARDLSRRILAFGSERRSERRPVPLAPIVREVVDLLRSAVPATVALRLEIDADDAYVMAESTELHQVIMNLCTNAIRAAEERGGTIAVRASTDPERGEAVLMVRDDGPGIAGEELERVFDPYFTTRAAGEGTGLGLTIVRHIVDDLGGSVGLRSAPGEGTTATVRLPTVSAPDPSTAGVGDDRGAPADGDGREERRRVVLVVDDEPLVRSATRLVLHGLGYEVREAASPESAIRQVHDDPGGIDVVVTDHAMPGMTGLGVAEHIHTIRSDLPVVLISGYFDDDTRRRAGELGVRGMIQKPFDRRTLAAALSAALGAVAGSPRAGLVDDDAPAPG